MTSQSEDPIVQLASDIMLVATEVLEHSSNQRYEFLSNFETISPTKIVEVASFVLRDLGRIESDQSGEFSLSKFVGYIGFWFAKLKPINSLKYIDKKKPKSDALEILDINERVSLLVASKVFWGIVKINPEFQPIIWNQCTKVDCLVGNLGAKGLCFKRKHDIFLQAQDGKFREYIEYGLRHRSISPYFLVHHFDAGIAYSCEAHCPAIFDASSK